MERYAKCHVNVKRLGKHYVGYIAGKIVQKSLFLIIFPASYASNEYDSLLWKNGVGSKLL